MYRATSARLYGNGWPVSELTVPVRAPRRAYGLRSAGAPDGWYPSGGRRPRAISRDKVDPVTNLVGPVDDDRPVRVVSRVDHDRERKIVRDIMGTLRQGEW